MVEVLTRFFQKEFLTIAKADGSVTMQFEGSDPERRVVLTIDYEDALADYNRTDALMFHGIQTGRMSSGKSFNNFLFQRQILADPKRKELLWNMEAAELKVISDALMTVEKVMKKPPTENFLINMRKSKKLNKMLDKA